MNPTTSTGIRDRPTLGRRVGIWLFAALFVAGGIGHFVATNFYMKMMPPYLPFHRALVLVSGVFEIALGVGLLIPGLSKVSAWGLIALLVAVFPANIHVYLHQEAFPMPPLLHLIRLPLQALLILWAYAYTRNPKSSRPSGAQPIEESVA